MLLPGSRLLNIPIMGLQTGTKLAQTSKAIVDPSNLKIIGYIVDGPLLSVHPSIIRMADVRELSDIGMIVDSNDEFIGTEDVIKVNEIYRLNFNPIGMKIVEESGGKLGVVEDYNIDSSSFIIQQLSIKRGLIKSLTISSLLIHRSQIIEINNKEIVVKTTAKRVEPVKQISKNDFVNPFRNTNPQPDS